jgi:Tol biopolymer transport system component
MNADRTNRRRVTISNEAEERPSWSRDGRYRAFQSAKREGGPHDAYIHVVEIATGTDRRLGAHEKPYFDETPSWFPDGKRISFQRAGALQIAAPDSAVRFTDYDL